ncbi:hypothetical protein N7539_001434 [Penicillium diatomitis]|uniref:Uncharacterized protein n=1 Tax=Penicillium diatomitis TaxID=2819901 RepID=A0A9W9XGZ7_9EURO|nr:uncharacterized protein N7539_001434 [Penicillium diatomitis]KAJ5492688.1 hypothetical protein N7539_001434 [Penicillium diatomitis]
MARLNSYLYRINVAETDYNTHRGNLSFFLGGKSPSDSQQWIPNLEAVRASIRFAIATGRLDAA